ncbi:MAG: hypothetical protein ACPGO5_03875 [Patescibacteria group bacterium]
MKRLVILLIIGLVLASCAHTRKVGQPDNPDADVREGKNVAVSGWVKTTDQNGQSTTVQVHMTTDGDPNQRTGWRGGNNALSSVNKALGITVPTNTNPQVKIHVATYNDVKIYKQGEKWSTDNYSGSTSNLRDLWYSDAFDGTADNYTTKLKKNATVHNTALWP